MALKTDKSTRKNIHWTDSLVNTIEFLYLNGYSDEDVAAMIPCSVSTLKFRLQGKKELKTRFDQAKQRAVSKATESLMKIAEGYHEYDVYYGEEMKLRVKAQALFDDLIEFIPDEEKEGFLKRRDEILGEGEVLKTVKKWYPPNKDAINKILDNHREQVWDSEARHRKIPDVKINVTLDGKKKYLKQSVTPDYVIENE